MANKKVLVCFGASRRPVTFKTIDQGDLEALTTEVFKVFNDLIKPDSKLIIQMKSSEAEWKGLFVDVNPDEEIPDKVILNAIVVDSGNSPDDKLTHVTECVPEHVNIAVESLDGTVVHFRIKKSTPLSKLIHAYCDRQGLREAQMRFRFDDNSFFPHDTPQDLNMKDGDVIIAFQCQCGC